MAAAPGMDRPSDEHGEVYAESRPTSVQAGGASPAKAAWLPAAALAAAGHDQGGACLPDYSK